MILSPSSVGSPSVPLMVPRAYAVIGTTAAAVLATLVAAGLTTKPILGSHHVEVTQAPPPGAVRLPPAAPPGGEGFPTWLATAVTVFLALYALSLIVLIALRRRRRKEDNEPES